jgi:hypothetical protein
MTIKNLRHKPLARVDLDCISARLEQDTLQSLKALVPDPHNLESKAPVPEITKV